MLKGTLDDFTLPDMFRLMSFAKKTGRLDITRSAGNGKVFFQEGEVYYAESSLSKEPLGQKLIRARAITEGQLMKALDENAATGRRVGEILVSSGVLGVEQLEDAVKAQIEDAVFDLLRWELGEFEWEPGAGLNVEVPITVSVENLIMEASRRLDELEVIKRKIPSGETVLGMAPTPPEGAVEINITPDEWRILVLVDGTRTVNDIAAVVGLDEFGAMRVLYGLVSAGLIEVTSHEAAPQRAAPTPEPEPVAVAMAPAVTEHMPAPIDLGADTPVEPPAASMEVAEVPEPSAVEPVIPEHEHVVAEHEETLEPVAASDFGAELADVLHTEPADDGLAAEPVEVLDAEATLHDLVDLSATDAEAEPAPSFDAGDIDIAASGSDWPADETISVEAFDSPGPDELVTETPAELTTDTPEELLAETAQDLVGEAPTEGSFLGDLLEERATPVAHAPQPPSPVEPSPVEPIPAASEPGGEAPSVDRAAVVRELAGLFSDEERPRARPPVPAGEPTAPGQPDQRKRVEDDDQVTKGLISRLIDGVKGL